MKYKEALAKHNLTPETVSKGIRDRIAELNESVELENEIRQNLGNGLGKWEAIRKKNRPL